MIHLATHGSLKGRLVLRGDGPDDTDALYHSSDVYRAQAEVSRDLRPDIVVLNTCETNAESVVTDKVDGIVRALLSCGTYVRTEKGMRMFDA